MKRLSDLVRLGPSLLRRSLPWLAAVLLLGVAWSTDLSATFGLFQSPLDTPTLEPAIITAPALTATVSSPTASAPAAASATAAAPLETSAPETPTLPAVPVTPTLAVTFTAAPAVATSGPPRSPTLTVQPEPIVAETAAPLPTHEPFAAEPTEEEEGQRYPTEEANLKYDWRMLFDSLALALSYVWLVCGVVLLVFVPVMFAILWSASKRRSLPEPKEPDVEEETPEA